MLVRVLFTMSWFCRRSSTHQVAHRNTEPRQCQTSPSSCNRHPLTTRRWRNRKTSRLRHNRRKPPTSTKDRARFTVWTTSFLSHIFIFYLIPKSQIDLWVDCKLVTSFLLKLSLVRQIHDGGEQSTGCSMYRL